MRHVILKMVDLQKIWSCKGIIVSQVHRKSCEGVVLSGFEILTKGSFRIRERVIHYSPISSDILMYYTGLVGEPEATMSVTSNMLLHPVQASFIIFLPPIISMWPPARSTTY